MKSVRCSWVDMQKLRESLSGGKRGDQTALTNMRCVDASTVSTWKATADLMEAMDGKVDLNQLCTFQPTHAKVLARHMRKTSGRDPEEWDADVIAEWVDECETKELTVEQFRDALKASLVPAASGKPGSPSAPDGNWFSQGEEQFREAIGCLRKARELFDEILRSRVGKFLREAEVEFEVPLFSLQLIDTDDSRGRKVENLWLSNHFEVVLTAAERVRPIRVCFGCQGKDKDCLSCMGSGFVPADKKLLETHSQRELNFGDPGVPWESSDEPQQQE